MSAEHTIVNMPNNKTTTTTTTTTTTNINSNGSSSNNGNNNGFFNATAGSGPSFSIGSTSIHFTYFLVLILSLIVSIRYLSWKVTLYEFIVIGPILFVTIMTHEFGHTKMSQSVGGGSGSGTTANKEIILWPLGGLTINSINPNPATPRNMLMVAAGGPAIHLFQILFWIILAVIFQAIGNKPGWSINYDIIMGTNNFGDYFIMIPYSVFFL